MERRVPACLLRLTRNMDKLGLGKDSFDSLRPNFIASDQTAVSQTSKETNVLDCSKVAQATTRGQTGQESSIGTAGAGNATGFEIGRYHLRSL